MTGYYFGCFCSLTLLDNPKVQHQNSLFDIILRVFHPSAILTAYLPKINFINELTLGCRTRRFNNANVKSRHRAPHRAVSSTCYPLIYFSKIHLTSQLTLAIKLKDLTPKTPKHITGHDPEPVSFTTHLLRCSLQIN